MIRDKQENTETRASLYIEKHGWLGDNIQEAEAMEGGTLADIVLVL